MEKTFAIITAVLGGYGLLSQSNILFGKFRREEFVYYTSLSNLLVFVYHVLLIIALNRPGGGLYSFVTNASVSFAVMACILVTFIIFHFVLASAARKAGLHFRDITVRFWGNLCVHYLVPLLTFFEWLVIWDKSGLDMLSAVWWLALPLLYFIFVLIRARFVGEIKEIHCRFPYPFIDRDSLGPDKFLRNSLAVLLAFFVLGLALVLLGKLVTVYAVFPLKN